MITRLTIPQVQERMSKVLAETVQYYCEDPSRRAVDAEGECSYYDSKTDNVCAVGRCLIDPVDSEGVLGNVHDLFDQDDGVGDNILKPEWRGLPVRFWLDLQDWHDSDSRWADHAGLYPHEPGYDRQHCCDDTHAVAQQAQHIRDKVNDGTYILQL